MRRGGGDRDTRVGQLAHDPVVQGERTRGIEQAVFTRAAGREQHVGEVRCRRRVLDRGDRLRQRARIVGVEATQQRARVRVREANEQEENRERSTS